MNLPYPIYLNCIVKVLSWTTIIQHRCSIEFTTIFIKNCCTAEKEIISAQTLCSHIICKVHIDSLEGKEIDQPLKVPKHIYNVEHYITYIQVPTKISACCWRHPQRWSKQALFLKWIQLMVMAVADIHNMESTTCYNILEI